MIDEAEFNQRIKELEKILQHKLSLRGKNLTQRLKKARQRLPERIQKAGRVITGVQAVMANPKLARIQNQNAIDTAFAEITTYLKTYNRRHQRNEFALGIAGDLVIRLILLGGAVLAILRWQGII